MKHKIDETDLEYTDAEAVCLDRYLATSFESKHEWARRVWDSCRLHAEGNYIARVYATKINQTWQDRAKELWHNKKYKRRIALCKEFDLKEPSDEEILSLKQSDKYKTRDELEALEDGKL